VKLAGVTLNQFLKITVCAIVGIVLFKLLASKSKITGLQDLAAKV
jgi:hypothetical protein